MCIRDRFSCGGVYRSRFASDRNEHAPYNSVRGNPMRKGSGSVMAKGMLLVFACAVLVSGQGGSAQRGTTGGEWRHYGGDAGGTKYSPLDQINASNVNKLQIAWRWKTSSLGQAPDYNWQATPLMIGDTLYFTAGSQRSAVAI